MLTHTHITSLVYTDVYTEHEYTPSPDKHVKLWTHTYREALAKMKGTMYAAESLLHTHTHTRALNISPHLPSPCTHEKKTHTSRPSPQRPDSLDPTDSLQSALEPRGSSLPLEPVSDTVIWHWQWQWQSQRAPPAHTPSAWEDQTTLKKGQDPPPLPPRSHCSDCCCCCFKGVFVQKCSFYDCYYNYCYDYLIKDLYHTGKKNGKDFS